MKYRLKSPDGAPVDRTIEDTWRRVATALAAPEREPSLWAERFYERSATSSSCQRPRGGGCGHRAYRDAV